MADDYGMFSRACRGLGIDPSWKVVIALNDKGDCTIDELLVETDLDISDLHNALAELLNGGIIVNLITTKGSVYRLSGLGERIIENIITAFEEYYVEVKEDDKSL